MQVLFDHQPLLAATKFQNTAAWGWLDRAIPVSLIPNYIVSCTWSQAACILRRSYGFQYLQLWPPSFCCNAAINKMLQIIEARPYWPTYADDFEHPPPQLAFRHPLLSDMTSLDIIAQWREDWSSASVVNHTVVIDRTIQQPGFILTRHTWSLLNCFWLLL